LWNHLKDFRKDLDFSKGKEVYYKLQEWKNLFNNPNERPNISLLNLVFERIINFSNKKYELRFNKFKEQKHSGKLDSSILVTIA